MRRLTLLILAGVSLAGCGSRPSHAAPPAPKPVVSIQELMDSVVDPAADGLWGAVGSVVTAAGAEDRRPNSDADWAAVRAQAVALAEAPNLLALPGRPVVAPGHALQDTGVKGIHSAAQIESQLAADRGAFAGYALGLQGAARQALAAVDARDPEALMNAGAAIDEACESCHLKYWYPDAPRPSRMHS